MKDRLRKINIKLGVKKRAIDLEIVMLNLAVRCER